MKARDVGRCKVAHVVGELLRGGTERIVLDLLSRLDKERFEVDVLTTSSEGLPEIRRAFERAGCRIDQASWGLGEMSGRGWGGIRLARKAATLWRVTSALRRGRYRIVHTHGLTNNLYGRLAAILAGARLIITHEHNVPEEGRADRILWMLLNRRTACNLSVSETVARRRAELAPSSRQKGTTLLNGIDLDRFHPPASDEREAARKRFCFGRGERVAGIVARLVSWKRVDLFLRAASRVATRCPEARFLVVGDGEERSRLEEQCNASDIGRSVRFTGLIRRPEEAFRAMDLCCVTSDGREGFGLATVEAMASGLPIVAVESPLTREIVSERCGLFVEPTSESIATGMETLIRNRERAAALGTEAARRASRRYDIGRAGRELEALYGRLLQRKASCTHDGTPREEKEATPCG